MRGLHEEPFVQTTDRKPGRLIGVPGFFLWVILAGSIVSGAALAETERKVSLPGSFRGLRIAIDPGHGGADSGAVGISADGTAVLEKDCNLGVARYLSSLLERAGAAVLLTRSSDLAVSLASRAGSTKDFGADLVISIHHNSTTPPVNGNRTEMYWKIFDPGLSSQFARKAAPETARALGLKWSEARPGNFMILRNSSASALLTEGAFLCGDALLETLMRPAGQFSEAESLFRALAPVARRISGRTRLDGVSAGELPVASVEAVEGRSFDPSGIETLELMIDGRAVPSRVGKGTVASLVPVGPGRHMVWCRQRLPLAGVSRHMEEEPLLVPFFSDTGPSERRPALAIDWSEDRGAGPLGEDGIPFFSNGKEMSDLSPAKKSFLERMEIFGPAMAMTVESMGRSIELLPLISASRAAADRLLEENLKMPLVFLGIYPSSDPNSRTAVIGHYHSSSGGRRLATEISAFLRSRGIASRVEGGATFFLSYTTAAAVEISWPRAIALWRIGPTALARLLAGFN